MLGKHYSKQKKSFYYTHTGWVRLSWVNEDYYMYLEFSFKGYTKKKFILSMIGWNVPKNEFQKSSLTILKSHVIGILLKL